VEDLISKPCNEKYLWNFRSDNTGQRKSDGEIAFYLKKCQYTDDE
jgi:hypothetical protein